MEPLVDKVAYSLEALLEINAPHVHKEHNPSAWQRLGKTRTKHDCHIPDQGQRPRPFN